MQGQTPERFPRKVLIAATALAVLTIVSAGTARWSGLGATREPQGSASQTRELRFQDLADGSIAIYQAADGHLVDTLAPGTSGFVRIVMRSLARERRMNDQGQETPFRLVRWQDGRLSVDDPTTGRHIDLGAFGAANTQSFARLIVPGDKTQ
jgi:putative photosynthetic complex assembly protein